MRDKTSHILNIPTGVFKRRVSESTTDIDDPERCKKGGEG
jgi:hypothetical protein